VVVKGEHHLAAYRRSITFAAEHADEEASDRNALVVKNLPLAIRMAKQGEDFEERLAICNLALVKAAGAWKPDGGARFSTYATCAMRNELMRQWGKGTVEVKVAGLKYVKELKPFVREHGRLPTFDEWKESHPAVPRETYRTARGAWFAMLPVLSLETLSRELEGAI